MGYALVGLSARLQQEQQAELNYKGVFYKLVYYLIRKCSYAWPLFKLSLVSFSPLNTYIARYARVRRTEIYCAIARKLSQANL